MREYGSDLGSSDAPMPQPVTSRAGCLARRSRWQSQTLALSLLGQPTFSSIHLFHGLLISDLVFKALLQVLPDEPDPLHILSAVFPGLQVSHRDTFRGDISLLLQIVELVSGDVYSIQDLCGFHFICGGPVLPR